MAILEDCCRCCTLKTATLTVAVAATLISLVQLTTITYVTIKYDPYLNFTNRSTVGKQYEEFSTSLGDYILEQYEYFNASMRNSSTGISMAIIDEFTHAFLEDIKMRFSSESLVMQQNIKIKYLSFLNNNINLTDGLHVFMNDVTSALQIGFFNFNVGVDYDYEKLSPILKQTKPFADEEFSSLKMFVRYGFETLSERFLTGVEIHLEDIMLNMIHCNRSEFLYKLWLKYQINSEFGDNDYAVFAVLVGITVLQFVQLVFNILLMFGAAAEKPSLLKAWVIQASSFLGLQSLVYFVVSVASFLLGDAAEGMISIAGMTFNVGVGLVFILVVYSFYVQLRYNLGKCYSLL